MYFLHMVNSFAACLPPSTFKGLQRSGCPGLLRNTQTITTIPPGWAGAKLMKAPPPGRGTQPLLPQPKATLEAPPPPLCTLPICIKPKTIFVHSKNQYIPVHIYSTPPFQYSLRHTRLLVIETDKA